MIIICIIIIILLGVLYLLSRYQNRILKQALQKQAEDKALLYRQNLKLFALVGNSYKTTGP